MSLYARADLASVTVSAAHGGCGEIHTRPAPGGNPVAVWKLDCSACTQHLRHDPLWSATVSEIPETPDEVLTREDWEKRGVRDRDNLVALALGHMTGLDIPETMRNDRQQRAIAGKLICADGHDCEPGSKFCAECGGPVRRIAPVAACPQGHQVAATVKFCPECGSAITVPVVAAIEAPSATAPQPKNAAREKPLKDRRAVELKAMARERGLDDSGTRADVLARLRAA